jgi:hypothetical protein
MYFVAWGVMGLGDWIWEIESGLPFGISTLRLKLSRRDSRLDEVCLSLLEWCFDERFSRSEEECLVELVLEEDLWEDFSLGTSRMFKTRPVVGSVVEDCPGSWETWYPSMM